MFDPTSSRAAFGGAVRSAIGKLPGGAATMDVVDTYAAERRTTDRSAPTDRAPAAPRSASSPWYARTGTLVAAGVAVLALALALVFFRRK